MGSKHHRISGLCGHLVRAAGSDVEQHVQLQAYVERPGYAGSPEALALPQVVP